MFDLLVTNAMLPGAREALDIACDNGKIAAIGPNLSAPARRTVDAGGWMASPPFVDSHFHLDSTLSRGRPRLNRSGTLLEGIQIWGELKGAQSVDDIVRRARTACLRAAARGVLAIRSHVDVSDPSMTTVSALLQVREEMRPYLDIQLVAFPQDGFFRDAGAEKRLLRALDMGVDVVGGIPHFERTMREGAESVSALCRIAADRGLMVDMHCDETDDPHSRHIETLARETLRFGLRGRVAGSHLTSMHSMDNYYVSKLLPLMAEAEVAAIPNPLINVTLQGRHDSYPKRRGMTRVRELWENGVRVAFGHDCVMDPWYFLGSHDMLEVAAMAVHVGHLTSPAQIKKSYDAVTTDAADILGLKNPGLAKGIDANFVILQAAGKTEAIRLRPARLLVVRRGKILARTAPAVSEIFLGADANIIDFSESEFAG